MGFRFGAWLVSTAFAALAAMALSSSAVAVTGAYSEFSNGSDPDKKNHKENRDHASWWQAVRCKAIQLLRPSRLLHFGPNQVTVNRVENANSGSRLELKEITPSNVAVADIHGCA